MRPRRRKLRDWHRSKKSLLRAPLTEEQVREFEAAWKIELPPEYRAFLLTVGDGGPGPYYGILPLERGALALPEPELDEPCPLTPDLELEPGNWMRQLGLGPDDNPYRGLLAVSSCGCTYWCTLVVSGPARGRICYINEVVDCEAPYFPEDEDFLTWYERWLDELESGADMGWFGFGAKGDESRLRTVLVANPSAVGRRDATFSLAKRSRLSIDSVRALDRASREDPAPSVRASAVHALRRVRFGLVRATLKATLDDPSPVVRAATLSVLGPHRRVVGDEPFVAQLASDDESVVEAAVFSLLRGSTHHLHAEFAKLLEHSNPRIRTNGAYALVSRRERERTCIVRGNLNYAIAAVRRARRVPGLGLLRRWFRRARY